MEELLMKYVLGQADQHERELVRDYLAGHMDRFQHLLELMRSLTMQELNLSEADDPFSPERMAHRLDTASKVANQGTTAVNVAASEPLPTPSMLQILEQLIFGPVEKS